MKIKQIRNATNRIEYAGTTFLVDPWLMPKHQFSFSDIPGMPYHTPDSIKEHLVMPFYDLPESMESILSGVDYYVVTHLHPDHIDMSMDGTVGAPLDKSVPVICQNEADAEVFRKSGFQDITVLSKNGQVFGKATLTNVPARHGTVIPCGDVMGIVFQAEGEKTLYLAGDTVWYEGVEQNLSTYQPEVIMLNACAAETVENGRLIMDDEEVACVAKAAPKASLYLNHFNNVAHAAISRHEMRAHLLRRNVTGYVLPEDGECVEF